MGGGAPKVPEATVLRMSAYSRFLAEAGRRGVSLVSSDEMSSALGVSAHTIRRDLNYFGEFGIPGVGYEVSGLYRRIQSILGLDQRWPTVVVGVSGLGNSLLDDETLCKRGFDVVAGFDPHPEAWGSGSRVPIYPLEDLPEIVDRKRVVIGIIAASADRAQEVANLLSNTPVKAILNFSGAVVSVPGAKEIEVKNLDVSANLELLTYRLAQRISLGEGVDRGDEK